MPPAALAGSISGHGFRAALDGQLAGGVAHGGRRRLHGIVEEGAEQPDRAELNRNTEAVVVAAVLGDEGAVSVVEVEMAGELVGRGLVREAAVAAGLVVGDEADRHCRGCLSCRGC